MQKPFINQRIHKASHQGFTLVELSIVLVILGLLVGGVLTGQSLIRAAELRSITTQYNGYLTAVNSFKDKYFALPGDMNNAQSFWGVAHATPATCVTTVGTGTQTCNGDGDGLVWYAAAGSNETFRFWQHLANAGLIEGSYRGTTDGSNGVSATTTNSPRGKSGSSLWFVYSWGVMGNTQFFNGTYNNTFELGSYAVNSDPATPFLKVEEMWNIDTKMDDGKPATGRFILRVTAGSFASCTDAAGSSSLSANYLLSSTALACVPLFPNSF